MPNTDLVHVPSDPVRTATHHRLRNFPEPPSPIPSRVARERMAAARSTSSRPTRMGPNPSPPRRRPWRGPGRQRGLTTFSEVLEPAVPRTMRHISSSRSSPQRRARFLVSRRSQAISKRRCYTPVCRNRNPTRCKLGGTSGNESCPLLERLAARRGPGRAVGD